MGISSPWQKSRAVTSRKRRPRDFCRGLLEMAMTGNRPSTRRFADRRRKDVDNEICRYFGWPTHDWIIRPADGIQGLLILLLCVLVLMANTAMLVWEGLRGRLSNQQGVVLFFAIGAYFGHWWYQVRQDHRSYRRYIMGLCPSCAYDLRGSPGRCPECGKMSNKPRRPRTIVRMRAYRIASAAKAARSRVHERESGITVVEENERDG
jgi:hypothetical protein